MASFNKVILVGNLTRDPEVRVASNNNTICRFGLAVSRTYTTKEGEKREEATFVDIDSFGKTAEILGKYLQKGRPLMVEGRLQLDQWEGPNGEKRSKLKVVCENFQFLGSRGDSEGGSSRDSAPSRSQQGTGPDADNDAIDDDIPF